KRVLQRGRRNRLIIPAGGAKLAPRAGDVEIGHRNEMHPLGQTHLGDEHGAELARPDEADGNRTARSLPFEQHGVEIHAVLRSSQGVELLRQTNRELSSAGSYMRPADSVRTRVIGTPRASRKSRSDTPHRSARGP